VRSRELDFMILMGPFQLQIFYDSTILFKNFLLKDLLDSKKS